MRLRGLVVAAVLVGCAGEGEAPDDCRGAKDGVALQAALDAGGRIELCEDGVYNGPWTVPVDVEIVGHGAALSTSGEGAALTLGEGVSLVASELRIASARGEDAGGIDGSLGAALTLTDVVIEGCAGDVGGVLAPDQAFLTRVTLLGNQGQSAGALSVSTATLEDVRIEGNSAAEAAGVRVRSGGLVYADAATVAVGNISSGVGGGLILEAAAGWIGGHFEGNHADLAGGGAALLGAGAVLQSAGVDGNTTDGDGGGVAVLSGATGMVSVVGTSLVDNVATGSGGGVYLEAGAQSLTLQCTWISGNDAALGGGVAFVGDGAAGGALLMNPGTNLTGNTARTGGGLALDAAAEVQFLEAVVQDNVADAEGGGAWLERGTLTSTSTTWSGNAPEDLWVDGAASTAPAGDFTVEAVP